MTTATVPSTDLPGRCPQCGFHPTAQGHRSSFEGTATGCDDSGPLGEQLRDEAFGRLDSAVGGTDENAWLRREIVALGHRKMEFTPDDLPAHVRESTNPNRRGRVFKQLVEDRQIREVGRAKSRNPKAHGKTVGVYRLRVGP